MTQHSLQRAPSQLVNTADFAARDERICCLSYGVMRKLAGLPQDLFAGYWRDVLGPLCARLPGVGYYVQHHFSQDHRANLWPLPDGIRRMDVVLDGAVEIGFADNDGQNRYVKASPVLFRRRVPSTDSGPGWHPRLRYRNYGTNRRGMRMGKLQGKVAVFTGGTQGIGFTTAKLKTRDSAQARTVVCEERPRGVSSGGTE